MRIDDLRYLVAIAEFGSISKASKHLFISQQGLSQAIQQLEKSLDVVLLTRNGNRIYFTEIGERFVQSAREILAKHDELLNMIKPFPDNERTITDEEIITVYSTAFLCLTIIPEFLHHYQKKHPNLNLHIVEKRPSEILNIIANDKNAIGLFNTPDFKFKPQIFKENNLTFEKLMKCEQMLCVSRSSPLAAKGSVRVDDIAKCKFAIFDFEQEVDITNYIFTNIQQPNIILKTTNQKLYMDIIINGFAVGFTNTFLSNFLEKNTFSTIPFDPPIDIFIGLLLNANHNFTSNTEIFLNSFRKLRHVPFLGFKVLGIFLFYFSPRHDGCSSTPLVFRIEFTAKWHNKFVWKCDLLFGTLYMKPRSRCKVFEVKTFLCTIIPKKCS